MNKRKGFLIAIGVFYLVLTFAFAYGYFDCLNKIPGDPDEAQLLYFGLGFFSLPSIFLVGMIVPFFLELRYELINSSVKEKESGSAEPGSGKNQP